MRRRVQKQMALSAIPPFPPPFSFLLECKKREKTWTVSGTVVRSHNSNSWIFSEIIICVTQFEWLITYLLNYKVRHARSRSLQLDQTKAFILSGLTLNCTDTWHQAVSFHNFPRYLSSAAWKPRSSNWNPWLKIHSYWSVKTKRKKKLKTENFLGRRNKNSAALINRR